MIIDVSPVTSNTMKPRIIPILWHDCIHRVPVGFHPMAATVFCRKIGLEMK